LPMLVAQATAAAGYFLGTPGAFEKDNERIISQMERQMRNIVLIGMPGCGKSTIGKIISEITEKPFADIDDEIVKEAGISIPEIFEKEGETGFRDRETEITEKLGKQRGLVIAAGGGTVLRRKNLDALRQNALIIHIKRDLETLATKGRPLSKDMNTLREMEKIRLPIYRSAADITFDNSKSRSKGKLTEALKELLGYN
ncbi:MAG: shikimate kinase, partial [Anaerovoracaceae bacterium]